MIRNAYKEDAREIAVIMTEDLGYDTTEGTVINGLSGLDKNREAVLVSVDDDKICGVIHVEKYHSVYFKPIANIMVLAVRGDCHRKGHGRRLMNAAEEWAKEKGLYGIRLESGAHRENAHKFYRAMGFDYESNRKKFRKEF